MTRAAIKVMIVDDSRVARLLLGHIFKKAGMQVIASFASAAGAIAFLETERADVIVMDVEMPGMNGLEATSVIMKNHPLPIVIASNVLSSTDAEHTFRCLEAGELALVEKPVGPAHPDYAAIERRIIRAVCAMAEVKVVRRWPARVRAAPADLPSPPAAVKRRDVKLVAIGASTGGPTAIRAVLEGLSKGFPLPVVIVQHMSEGFVEGLAQWLTSVTGFPVSVASDGERLLPGRALLAPDGVHMGIARGMKIVLSNDPPENGAQPSVSHLFRSVAATLGAHAAGILLTGMGTDGASGLKQLHDAGGLTMAEASSTAAVYGMPREAVELGAAELILTPPQIANILSSLTNRIHE